MDLNTVKIVVDSSADLTHLDTVPFQSVPLRIITAEGEYTDDAALNVEEMVDHLAHYKGRSSTACPSPEDWLNAFGEAEHIFCITITGTLSGSYNAARTASDLYREAHPERQVFVFDSLTAGPEITLMVEHLREKILSGASFEEVRASLVAYAAKTGVVFMLESMKNLANNGRVSPLVARMAGLLGIRVVGKASDHGTLEPIHKCRGEARALESLCSLLKELGWRQGRIRIAHCFNEEAALRLRDMIRTECAKARVEISRCRGLCSFYAERGGLLVGFERREIKICVRTAVPFPKRSRVWVSVRFADGDRAPCAREGGPLAFSHFFEKLANRNYPFHQTQSVWSSPARFAPHKYRPSKNPASAT